MTLEMIANWNSQQNPLENVLGKKSIVPTITTRVAESEDGGINASTILVCAELEKSENLKGLYRTREMGKEEPKCKQIMQLEGGSYTEMTGRVYSGEGLSPTVRTFSGGGTEIKVAIPYDEQNNCLRLDGTVGTLTTDGSSPKHNNRIVEFKQVSIIDDTYSNREPREYAEVAPAIRSEREGFKVKEARFFQQAIETFENNEVKNGDIIDAYNEKVITDGISPTVTTRPEGFKTAILPIQNYRIRKLTPKECFRLMGVKDEDFEKVKKHQSDSSLYHLAGDSIIIDVIKSIIQQLV